MTRLSIIIPTLNEENYIEDCVTAIKQNAHSFYEIEVIVIDSGSTDDTLSKIDPSIKVYEHPELVGLKFKLLNIGASYANGAYLLFLDADTIVPKHFDLLIFDACEKEICIGGAFEFSFIEQSFLLKVIQLCNRFRYRVRQSYYGDQGVYVTKSAFNEAGGFPPVRIMEAALFCRTLKKNGRLKLITSPVKTSGRRFIRGGTIKVFTFDLMIWIRRFLGLNIERYAQKYWNDNLTQFR